MELFSITCTTCQQRLKVRSAAAIGQILICPKCGSMVLVDPPQPLDAEPPPAADDSAAALPGEADDVGRVESRQAAVAAPASPAAEQPPPVKHSPLLADDGSRPSEADDPPIPDADNVPPPPLLPDDSWTSPRAQTRQQWLLIGLSAVVGIGLALGLVGLFATRGSGTAAVETPNPPAATAAEPAHADESPHARTAAASPGTAPADPEDENTAASEPQLAEPGTDELAEDPPAADEPATDEPVPASAEPELDAAVAEEPRQENPPAADADARAPEHSAETAAAEPSEAAGTSRPAEVTPADTAPPAAAAMNYALQAFAPFIQESSYAPPEAPAGEAAVPEADLEDAEEPVYSAPRPEPRAIDVLARLQDRIPRLQMQDVPLGLFLAFMADFSTIPITLDPDALALLRLTPQTPIQLDRENATVGELLTAALEPLRLGYTRAGDQLIVTRPAPPDGQFRLYRHPVGDLVGSSPERLDELVELITSMVERDSWDVAGGPGSLAAQMPELLIQNRDTVLFRTLLFCERLRQARGLSRTTSLDPARCELQTGWSRARAALEQPLRIRYPEPAPFLQIVQRLGKETGLQILIDWQALGELGWTPQAEATWIAEDVPLAAALDDLLRPMDLTYRIVDAVTLQITSPAAVRHGWDVEFYPVGDVLAKSPAEQPLSAHLQEALQQAGLAEGQAAIHLDRLSGHLIVAAPQPWQRRAEEQLQQWRTAAP